MPTAPAVLDAACLVARAHRDHRDDQSILDAARANLRTVKLEQKIRETVDAAPPLSAEQRNRLAVLLLGAEPLRAAV